MWLDYDLDSDGKRDISAIFKVYEWKYLSKNKRVPLKMEKKANQILFWKNEVSFDEKSFYQDKKGFLKETKAKTFLYRINF